MKILVPEKYLNISFDCLILVNSIITVNERVSKEFQEAGIYEFNINKYLSGALLPVMVNERNNFIVNWFMDMVPSFQNEPILCTHPDLLFEPSFQLNPLALFRQACRIKRLIILWPGDYSSNNLSYAVPEHHHFRTWKITDSILQQPVVLIQQISTIQGD